MMFNETQPTLTEKESQFESHAIAQCFNKNECICKSLHSIWNCLNNRFEPELKEISMEKSRITTLFKDNLFFECCARLVHAEIQSVKESKLIASNLSQSANTSFIQKIKKCDAFINRDFELISHNIEMQAFCRKNLKTAEESSNCVVFHYYCDPGQML